ncbi:MAG: hypothetical protein QW416_07850 [Candidatus Nitrosocaldaceae archaeon]
MSDAVPVLKIEGIAVYAGYSLNGYYFTYDALQAINTSVPLYVEHVYDRQIGEVRLFTSDDGSYLAYEGTIWLGSLTEEEVGNLKSGLYRVSIGVEVHEYYVSQHVNGGDVDEFILIHSIKPVELSLVKNPAFPLTTLYMQNAREINVNAEAIKEDILILRNKMADAGTRAGAINIISTKYNPITTADKGDINKDMTEDKPVISTNSEINHVLESLNAFVSRQRGHIKFTINAIDASPFATRSEMGIVPKPRHISANLEEFLSRGRVEGKNATWIVVPVVDWATFIDGTTPADATQNITEVTASVAYKGYRQSVTDLAKVASPVDLVGELVTLERDMIAYEIDKAIFDQRGEITTSPLDATSTLDPSTVLTAIRQIRATGNMSDLILLCPPKVFHDLMGSPEVSNFIDYGEGNTLSAKNGINEFFIYGVRVRMTSKEITEEVGDDNKLVSIMFPAGAIGVAIGNLEVEIFRDGNALKDVITIKRPFALKYLLPDHCIKIRSD